MERSQRSERSRGEASWRGSRCSQTCLALDKCFWGSKAPLLSPCFYKPINSPLSPNEFKLEFCHLQSRALTNPPRLLLVFPVLQSGPLNLLQRPPPLGWSLGFFPSCLLPSVSTPPCMSPSSPMAFVTIWTLRTPKSVYPYRLFLYLLFFPNSLNFS